MNNTPDPIENILNSLIRKRSISDGYDGIENAVLDIKEYVEQEKLKARIEELERLNVPEWELESYGNAIEDRLAQLTEDKEQVNE